MSSHVLIEYITSCEIQYTTVILIFWDKPRIKNRSEDLEQIYNKVTSHLEFNHSYTCSLTLYLCVYILQLSTFIFPQARCNSEITAYERQVQHIYPYPEVTGYGACTPAKHQCQSRMMK